MSVIERGNRPKLKPSTIVFAASIGFSILGAIFAGRLLMQNPSSVDLPPVENIEITTTEEVDSTQKYLETTQENPKLIKMIDDTFESMLYQYRYDPVFNPSIIQSCKSNILTYFKSFATVKTGSTLNTLKQVGSNYISIQITYNDGTPDTYIETNRAIFSDKIPILMEAHYTDGKPSNVFTNGMELKDSPSACKSAIWDLLNSLINDHKTRYPEHYFAPSPTQKDYDDEWNAL